MSLFFDELLLCVTATFQIEDRIRSLNSSVEAPHTCRTKLCPVKQRTRRTGPLENKSEKKNRGESAAIH